jgi:hypothetical protein
MLPLRTMKRHQVEVCVKEQSAHPNGVNGVPFDCLRVRCAVHMTMSDLNVMAARAKNTPPTESWLTTIQHFLSQTRTLTYKTRTS